ncbi:similar to Saccharomyces cerevisiae YBL022C PIM1 ATP-dependent Lon protease, involved in degradation of misfolded proteins in mitochondria [Maudiozyma saulgeensis]|uniref:endopeptidase La n=1 Tax=Maudiozyma saulgeensis TaxID=1789683 RepID=A0A1X7R8H4_9SACH|nr:similar to Saccharomyces cerevisiae YBL022C PIM1 ATP-dependent Lon protease, involved in degradation of misfolded proteins in mitochondria [Kazachstania saulgeensis]
MRIAQLPCIVHSTVILPGSQVQIHLENSIASDLLKLFNNKKEYDPEISRILNKQYPLTKNDSTITPSNYFFGIIPQDFTGDVGCLCRVISFKKLPNDTETTLIIRSLVRIQIETPLLNTGNIIWKSNVTVSNIVDTLSVTSTDQIKPIVLDVLKLTESLETTVNEFIATYKRALKRNTNEHFLLLSPLSNTLFFQLNNSQLKKNWTKIIQLRKEITNDILTTDNLSNISDLQLNKLLSLLDNVVAMIATPHMEKLHFLNALQFQDRIISFSNVVNGFINIFTELYSTTDYIKRYYSNATIIEKANLIANQLRSLKYFVNDVKGKPYIAEGSSSPKRIVYMGNTTNTNNKEYIDDDAVDDDVGEDDLKHIRNFIKNVKGLDIHVDALSMLTKDYRRLKKMHGYQHNAEYQLLRNYFDVIIDIPFGKYSGQDMTIDVVKSRKILNDDHFGLISVKQRLLEYLSVLKLNQMLNVKSNDSNENVSVSRPPILLLVGPPGVGKTSIAKSIAKVLSRKYQRISLGGIYNESDLRGHRRTYVGAMCGSIIDAIRKSGTMNPLILLDELDKVSTMDGKKTSRSNGDPEGALLEILDFEQNFSFMDHYVGFPVDISQVLFLCTANDASTISSPLLDRLEIIKIPGYTTEEKIQIGSKFLLPKQIKMNGFNRIPNGDFKLTTEAWTALVTGYTREAGVRNLERKLASIVRGKIVEYIKDTETNETSQNSLITTIRVQSQDLYKYLGFPLPSINDELLIDVKYESKVGLVNGLSYNSNGTGGVLMFEIVKIGKFQNENINNKTIIDEPIIKCTGNLGETLEESIKIATSLVESIIKRNIIDGINEAMIHQFLSSKYHIHAPMGGVPKDGPSAGMAITLALLSILLQIPIDRDICMTGEITLRGKILPIGGLKEKMLGAKMNGMKHILVPIGNRNDVISIITDDNFNEFNDKNFMAIKSSKDRQQIMQFRQKEDAKLLYDKVGLKLTYVNDIYDAMLAIWPRLMFKEPEDTTKYVESCNSNTITSKM